MDNSIMQPNTIPQPQVATPSAVPVPNPTAVPVSSLQPPQSSNQPNFLERMLPTIGGIVGGLAGLPLNALDAVSGIGGTALDAGLAGAGSGLGKTLENYFTHQGLGNGVLGQAALGALGQGAGEAIGAGVSGLTNALGSKALSTGADMIQGQAAKGFLNDGEANQLQNMGLFNLKQVPKIYNEVSGSNGMFPNMVKDTFANSNNGVDISGLDGVAKNLAAEQGTLDPTSIKQINSALNTAVNNSIPGSVTPIISKAGDTTFTYEPGALKNALPENTFAQTQKLEQLANTAYNKGYDPFTKQITDSRQAGLYQVFKGMANHLQNASFGGDNPIPLTDEMKTSLLNSPQMANLTTINPKVAASYGQQIANASNLQDLRPMQSLIVRANNAVAGTAAKEGTAAGTNAMATAKSVGAPISFALSHPLSALGSLLLSSKAADTVGASILPKIGNALDSKIMNSVIVPGASGALGVAGANLKNDIPSPTNQNLISNIPGTSSGQGTGVNMPPTGLPSTNIFGSLIPGSGVSNTYEPQAIQALLGMFAPMLLNSGIENNANASANKLAGVQAAESQIPQLQNLFNAAGGAQGRIGGDISQLGGSLFNQPSGNYQAQAQQLIDSIAKESGINSGSIQAPQLTSNPTAAQAALDNIQSLLSALGGQTPTSALATAP